MFQLLCIDYRLEHCTNIEAILKMKYIFGVLVLYFLHASVNAADGIGECHCPANATRCCKGKEGSLNAPPEFPDHESPAGGPANNLDAAVCYYYRDTLCIICRKGNSVQKCCTISCDPSIPSNEYLIGEYYYNETANSDWHDLFPKLADNTDYDFWSKNYGLHGNPNFPVCIPVTPGTCWNKLHQIVSSGDLIYQGAHCDGFLYVLP